MSTSVFWTWLGHAANILGLFGTIFSLFAWLKANQVQQELEQERKRQNRKIRVVLRNGSDKLELPVELRRAEFTRAEILGRIGMVPMKIKGQRFTLGHLNSPEFLQQINKIAENTGDDILIIPCKQEEFDQFDLN